MSAVGHGKVILFGEHGVVHGVPALAAAVEGGAVVEFTKVDGPTRLHIEPWGVDVQVADAYDGPERSEPLYRALCVARGMYDDDLELRLDAVMNLPGGAGMGSSAALGVAVLRAMDQARGLERSVDEMIERSLEWERVFHGNPSGVDNAMAASGGLAVYRRGEPIEPVELRGTLRLVVANSGESSSTKEMVASVGRQYEGEPERVGKIFAGMASIVQNARIALASGDWKSLGQLMTLNQALLNSLMLSTGTIEEMIETAKDAGSLGGKVTGAGGGGCMIALAADEDGQKRVAEALRGMGKDVYEVEIAG